MCGIVSNDMGEGILENTQSILKTIKVIKKVKKANDCSDKCSLSNYCRYYKWFAKKKTCYLMSLDYKKKKGFSTAELTMG